MIIVSDASPLIALSLIHQLDLIRSLYKHVLVPLAVWHEVVTSGSNRPGAAAIATADWVEQRHVANRQLVLALLLDLDPGEAEAIALATEVDADLLIMDERLGRRTARHFGLNVIGVIGVLIEAKQQGLLANIKAQMDQLRNIAGFRISDELYRRVLADQGEV